MPQKTGKIFKESSNAFRIANDILAVGYDSDGADHDKTIENILSICQKEHVKLNKQKCYFICMSIPFFKKILSRNGINPDLYKL